MGESSHLYWNLVGGKVSNMGNRVFEVTSEFYPEYKTQVVDSSIFDIQVAISKAKNSFDMCQGLDFDQRNDILKNVGKKLKFKDEEKEYVVKMTGMPLKSVEKYLENIPELLKNVPELIERRIGTQYGRIGGNPIDGTNMFKFLEPIEGIVYAVTPGNDPRVVPFVASWLVSLGIPSIFKVSKNDLRISELVINKIIELGYPSGGLNILCWNTSNPTKNKLHFKLVDSSKVIWAFGDDNTLNNKLRFEFVKNEDETKIVDHFSDKIVLKHTSGRAAGIVDADIDIKKASELIVSSAMHWPIGCNAMKALFSANDSHGELMEIIKIKLSKLKVGDSMNPKTDVGYVNPSDLSKINLRIKQLTQMGLLKIAFGGDRISDYQIIPILAKTDDVNSEFISLEYPVYILTTKSVDNYEKAIEELNKTSQGNKRLAVSVYSNDKNKILESKIKAHHVKMWGLTTELELLFHEGQDYLHKLTEPQIHRIVA